MRLWARFSLICLGLLAFSTPVFAFPTFQEIRTAHTPSDAWLLARDGRELQQLRLDKTARRLQWTPIEEVSPALLRALLFSEDKRFYEHAGVDWNAAAASAWRNLWNTKTRGASTLTMQLTGLLQEGAKGRQKRRNALEKAGQAADALWLDQRWQKDEILEAYLNLVGFRGELQGVSAMSHGLFGKSPAGLDERESAIAAALLRAPNALPSKVAQRACVLLKAMNRGQECDGLEGYVALHLRGPFGINGPDDAPHLARKLIERPGQRVVSSLDYDVQLAATRSLRANLLQLQNRNVQDGAVVVLDNATGEVLAWVGSSGDLSEASAFDAVTAPRQAGSTLKPFLYALAIEQKRLTAASLLDDSPVRISTSSGLYVPQNYDKHFVGPVSLRMALGSSLNVPAVRTLLLVGPDAFHQRLKKLGFETLRETGDYYGYSLALGSADVSLLALTNAYRTLANGGEWRPVLMQPRAPSIPAPYHALGPQAAAIVSDILSDRSARVHTFGLDSTLATRYWTAVKTGTSKDMRDNWCIGYSQRYTVGVWVGNAGGEPMHDVSGVSGAAPVWREVMDVLHRDRGDLRFLSVPPQMPKGVEIRNIRFEPPIEPPRREMFMPGTGQDMIRANLTTEERLDGKTRSQGMLRIVYPGEGTIIGLDPDIPPTHQRVVFKAGAQLKRDWYWRLDGKQQKGEIWFPMPGRHVLTLHDAAGQEVDRVRFEVRGASVKHMP